MRLRRRERYQRERKRIIRQVTEWSRRHPESVKERHARRRARLLGARLGCRTAYAKFLRWAEQARRIRCYWCKSQTRPGRRHIDHVIPLSRGGADAVGNLCVSCPSCNMSKSAKSPGAFSGQEELALA
jgi:5-methylcytosine-specific restriction endonuclease McrA